MKCKFCDAEFEQDITICPNCGKASDEEMTAQETVDDTAEEAVVEETATEELVSEEVPAEECAIEEQKEVATEKPKKKVWPWIAAIAGALIIFAGLTVALLFALDVIKIRPNDIHKLDAYTVSDEEMEKAADKVVARIGDNELTNAQLQVFYKMQVQEFLNYYGSYLTTIGLDYATPMSEQTCYFDESLTWEQYFLDTALKTWQNYQTMVLLAEDSGFTLSDEQKAELDKFPETMQKQAEENEYETAQEMIEDILGAGCTVDDYAVYVKLVLTSNEFYATEYKRLTPTDEEIEAYFDENVKTFEQEGITKDSGLASVVRHILISPEGGETNEETGETTYSEKEWNDAKKKAEDLLAKWEKGDATEESFAALVHDNTDDTGSQETGGLYDDVTPTSSYVKEFRAWAVDATREKGDTEIVKTQFGYHIMYFVTGEPFWMQEAGTMLLSERTTAMIEDAIEKWPMEVTYKKIVLSELDFG